MKHRGFLAIWFLTAAGLGAGPHGGVAARSEAGVLTEISTWWSPGPQLEGRWWWTGDGPGAVWVEVGPFQAGPLAVRAGAEGLRTWSAQPRGSSGRWGLAVDPGPWAVWAVQDPEVFEAGAQVGLRGGAWGLAASGDRTWPLTGPEPETGPWQDRLRAGLTWTENRYVVAGEATAMLPAVGRAGWAFRARAAGPAEPVSWSLRGAAEGASDGPRPASWSAEVRSGWEGWSARWKGRSSAPTGAATLGWEVEGTGLNLGWGPLDGWEATGTLRWNGEGGSWDLATEAQGEPTGSPQQVGLRLSAPGVGGRWSAGWSLATKGPVQTVTASYRSAGFEAGLRWKVEGWRLGWLGPGTSLSLEIAGSF